MVRTADEQRPVELLDAIVGYLTTHGVAELSLRPLAKAVGSSPRVLLYYFGSKEEMVVKALARLRERQRTTYNQMKAASFDSPSEACRAIWRHMSAPDSEPLFRLFFEAYVLALRHPQRFRDFLHTAIEDWLEFLAAPLCHKGYGQSEARAFATIVLAGFRGFMLDYCASQDRKRLGRAVDLWLHALDSIPLSGGAVGVDEKRGEKRPPMTKNGAAGTCAEHVEQDSRGDSLRCATVKPPHC